MTIPIDIDISKAKFDVCVYEPSRQHALKCFNNTLEATGVYGDKLCHYLHTLGVQISVINPSFCLTSNTVSYFYKLAHIIKKICSFFKNRIMLRQI